MVADDSKLWKVIHNEGDEENLQVNWRRLGQWSNEWLLPFNVAKCNIMRFGSTNTSYRRMYPLNRMPLPNIETQKDLGVWITPSLKLSLHCLKVAKSAMSTLYLIKHAFANFD
ncbi:unnamed protein product [Dibothriocephalus latus]|uniref:Reverse transcriptase domain-containing protein n=1 Tax=Dibothriocephalus latus TaxID=60516 RepID=A0A3P7NXN6_DIBLA|nr:unnamed protein product [Dibothriocephalus latus]